MRRQDIIDKLIDRIQTIATADGYLTDLGARPVTDWKIAWNSDELPAVSVCDLVADVAFPNDNPDASSQMHVLPVMIKIFLKDEQSAAEARKYLADVTQAIGDDTTFDGLALWAKLTKSGLVVPKDNLEIAGAAIELEIAYMTESWNAN